MTDAQTEARAIALKIAAGVIGNMDAEHVERFGTKAIATALEAQAAELAAKDAELSVQIEAKEHARRECERAEAQLAEARKELDQIERKICAAEHGHTINDVLANYREVRRAVQDARIARRALTGGQDDA